MHLDRLSALMARFALNVEFSERSKANLFVLAPSQVRKTARVVMVARAQDCQIDLSNEKVQFSAHVDWGGRHNPLLAALPDIIDEPVTEKLDHVLGLLIAEHDTVRCGSASVLNRLAEVLVVCLLREQLAKGTTEPGLLGGLANERISKAVVAIHENPGHAWRNGELAEIAGLSPSRFSEVFHAAVGETPAAYLRKWRLILAKQDIERGDRVQTVAWRYCYKSSEALGRAFRKMFGETPTGRPTSVVYKSEIERNFTAT